MTTSVTGAGRGATPARRCAFRVLRRVFEHDAYADRALSAEAVGLDARERSLAMQLAFGAVQRRGTIDWVIEQLAGRSVEALEPAVVAALRLGVFQILFLDGIAPHAAVNESVELAKSESRGGAGLVNAVLRRAVREGRALVGGLSDDTPEDAAVCHSVPQWLAEMWWRELGPARARTLLAAVNSPAESVLRINSLAGEPGEIAARLPVRWTAVSELEEAVELTEPFDAHGSPLFAEGAIMPQSRASMIVARALAPRPGERVLDLCAAPGGKTTHLAALMGDQGEVVAVERNRGRAAALRATLARMHVGCATVREGDAVGFVSAEPFDRVLVDPPCSGLGTLRSRPDRRWRASEAGVRELAGLQASILRAGCAALAPGGTLLYSVCTISETEGEGVIRRILDERPELELEDLPAQWPAYPHPAAERYLQTLPDRDGTDGFFIARLRRSL